MRTPQGLLANKEIAPDQQDLWGDSKTNITIDQSLAYIKCLALEKSINVTKTKSGYLVSHWNMAKYVDTYTELVCLVQKMGVKV